MIVHRLRNKAAYELHVQRMAKIYEERSRHERLCIPSKRKRFKVRGFSYPARRIVDFICNSADGYEQTVNWRETMLCPRTRLNNRLRASAYLIDSEIGVTSVDKIYITEQVTPFFAWLNSRYANVLGSEFLGSPVPRGALNAYGICNQDLSSLTFQDESFDVVLSFECFEHMPNFQPGLREVARVLKPKGRFMWSVPFRSDLQANLIRASHSLDGAIVHHEPPEYHGDPVSQAGCLCYVHFGWQMLEEVKECGFRDAYAIAYWSDVFGHFGTESFMFVAIK